MLRIVRATRRNHRHPDRIAHLAQQLEVVAGTGTVAVPAGEQNLAGASFDGHPRPLHSIQLEPVATRTDHCLPPVAGSRSIKGKHGALAAKGLRQLAEQLGPPHRRGVDGDLVGPRLEEGLSIRQLPHATTHRKRNRQFAAHRLHGRHRVPAALRGSTDVEQDDLVGALVRVELGQLHRLPGVAKRLELDPLDHPAGVDIEAGNDPAHQHRGTSSPSHRRSNASPHEPESSGWNWHPSTSPRSRAATKRPPCSLHAAFQPDGRSLSLNEFAK